MWKRLSVELYYMYFWRWKIFSRYYDDSTIICNEDIKSYDEEIKTLPTNFNEKKVTCKTQNFYILLGFLSSTIALLIAVSIYWYMIPYQTKHLLPSHGIKNSKNSVLLV